MLLRAKIKTHSCEWVGFDKNCVCSRPTPLYRFRLNQNRKLNELAQTKDILKRQYTSIGEGTASERGAGTPACRIGTLADAARSARDCAGRSAGAARKSACATIAHRPPRRVESGFRLPASAYQAAISRSTSGCISATRISVFAAPLGTRRPCSHCSSVRGETPSRAANCA